MSRRGSGGLPESRRGLTVETVVGVFVGGGSRESQCGGGTTLTALLIFLHAGAGRVVVAQGAVRRHGRHQRVTRGERRQRAVPHQFLQFTVPGVLERTVVPRVRVNPVEGDGAVVEVQGRRRRHVRRGAVMVEVRRAVAEHGLLLDGSGHQV